jgi:uncharacterized protein (DUF2141 family)
MKTCKSNLFTRALSLGLSAGLGVSISAGAVLANEAEVPAVPMTITLTDVIQSDVPLYISVQTKADYRSMKSHGTILKETSAGTLIETISLPSAGDYAVTVWHDLDNDGRFSMNERYEVLDGWGSSGDMTVPGGPTFETAKISVPNFGTEATVKMIYPKS